MTDNSYATAQFKGFDHHGNELVAITVTKDRAAEIGETLGGDLERGEDALVDALADYLGVERF